jgi:hypothetical protein
METNDQYLLSNILLLFSLPYRCVRGFGAERENALRQTGDKEIESFAVGRRTLYELKREDEKE